MSALPDLASHFRALEAILEAQPEGQNVEIARGVYAMTPRPRFRHAVVQTNLSSALKVRFGTGTPATPPDWLFAIEPEIRSEEAFSRLIPDVAGWRRSTTGWPDGDENPVTLAPDWVAEILSPGTEAYDRGPKREAWGLVGAGYLWIVDPVRRLVETFVNVRGKMIAGPVLLTDDVLAAPPFEGLSEPVAGIFL
ncbi:MAG: Uma2 family endonuclease [Holophagales bacterium]|nr:Uma2 family endonuclease [Holophagales bacterium]MBK9965358.1 Uma2 family endonuclease [Holophagales bacterium]